MNLKINHKDALYNFAYDQILKEYRPDMNEDEFIKQINEVREFFSNLPVTDQEFQEIVDDLQKDFQLIKIPGEMFAKEVDGDNWFNNIDRNSLHYWNRYKRYLKDFKKWTKPSISNLDQTSDEIMNKIGNPSYPGDFQKHGLIIGDIQSGKTANYTALINKAVDTGYKVIIVLTGISEDLRQQTQDRLDNEATGRKSSDDNLSGNLEKHIGVGLINKKIKLNTFTSVNSDFKAANHKDNHFELDDYNNPVLFVVKKHNDILKNLHSWLRNSVDLETEKIEYPLLFIDDEADNASINTNPEKQSPTAINRSIRGILDLFSKYSYLGITATPFANIFIDSEKNRQQSLKDLFPSDFIYLLNPPANYLGLEEMFLDGSRLHESIIPIDQIEFQQYLPYKHKKNFKMRQIPDTLKESIIYFLITNIILDYIETPQKHRSMLVHVSRFTEVQNHLATLINNFLKEIKTEFNMIYNFPDDINEGELKYFKKFQEVWRKYNLEESYGIGLQELNKEKVYKSIQNIEVIIVNSDEKNVALDYKNKSNGLRVIAVGGNSLARGLTLEGLIVSYFYRKSMASDTLMQMGRWFGYRDDYKDLFKVWMSEDAIADFSNAARIMSDFKEQIRDMDVNQKTPLNFGLKVSRNPNSLLITANNKMRNAKKIKQVSDYGGGTIETPTLYYDSEIFKQNHSLVNDFLNGLQSDENIEEPSNKKEGILWENVPSTLISELFQTFISYKNDKIPKKELSRFIAESDDKFWDVGFLTTGDGIECQLPITGVNDGIERVYKSQKRTVILDDSSNDKFIRIGNGRLGSPGAFKIVLNDKEKSKMKNPTDRQVLNKVKKPILLIYSVNLNHKLIPRETVVYALSIGFPNDNKTSRTVEYYVNFAEFKNLYEED